MRRAAWSFALWVGLAALTCARLVHLTIIELLFLLAPLVVVPLGLQLCAGLIAEKDDDVALRATQRLQFPAALLAVLSFWFPRSAAATILVAPWFFVGCLTGYVALKRLSRGRWTNLPAMCWTASFLYLPIGCAWLMASRLGLGPMGFHEPIVLLTAVHFHFAGFAAPLLVLAVEPGMRATSSAARRAFRAIAAGVLAGPALLAAGFVIGPGAKLAMAFLVACSEVGLAFCFLGALRTIRPRLAQALVALSAASVLFAMVLASVWAAGEFPLQPFVQLDQMARFHGSANGVGFVLCGLAGWSVAAGGKNPGEGGAR